MNETVRHLILGIVFSLIAVMAIMEGIQMNETVMLIGGILCFGIGMYCFFKMGQFSE